MVVTSFWASHVLEGRPPEEGAAVDYRVGPSGVWRGAGFSVTSDELPCEPSGAVDRLSNRGQTG
jgi:hypothetical protein